MSPGGGTLRSRVRVRAPELVGRGWLNTGGRALDLADLRGRVVVIDFWTFCCVNCLHVLDELRPLEARFHDALTVVGVHSPKFEHEADPLALAAAVERYAVHHPVLDEHVEAVDAAEGPEVEEDDATTQVGERERPAAGVEPATSDELGGPDLDPRSQRLRARRHVSLRSGRTGKA